MAIFRVDVLGLKFIYIISFEKNWSDENKFGDSLFYDLNVKNKVINLHF